MKRGVAVALVVCLAGAGGCKSPARIVSLNRQDGSGTVAIPNNTDSWPTHYRSAAEDLIAKEVGPSYRILSEGEFVKGKSRQLNLDGNSATYTQQKLTEYRITFVRVPGPGVPQLAPNVAGVVQTGGRGPAAGQAPPPGKTPVATPGTAP
jgi:hypothetical protein